MGMRSVLVCEHGECGGECYRLAHAAVVVALEAAAHRHEHAAAALQQRAHDWEILGEMLEYSDMSGVELERAIEAQRARRLADQAEQHRQTAEQLREAAHAVAEIARRVGDATGGQAAVEKAAAEAAKKEPR